MKDMSTKPQNIDTSEKRVQAIDKSIHDEIERLKAEIKRANELAEYRLKLLMQMPENKPEPWDTTDMAHRPNGLTIDDDDIQEYKRPWVGLSDEEVAIYSNVFNGIRLVREIEAVLKERNT